MAVLTVKERGEDQPQHLRKAGIIPMGLIERGKPTRKVQATEAEVLNALRHTSGAGMLEMIVEGETKKLNVFVKQVERAPLTNKVMNVNFAVVAKGESITADVAVHAVGVPEEAKAGTAVVVQGTTHIKLRGQPDDLPAYIEVDISELKFGEHIHTGDLPLPPKTELIGSTDSGVFSLQPLRAMEVETPAEGEATEEGAAAPTEPEVVGENE